MAGSGDGKPGKPATGLRVLIAGGGTGGHVYPGLAVAEALLAAEPGAEVRFAGTRRGLEFLLVPKAGFRLHTVPASGFRGLGPLARLRFLVNFLAGLLCSLWLLLTWRPAVVLGTGGYVSAPVLAAARLLRLRCALQEQNAIPGSANRLLARWVEKIYLGFGEAAEFFPGRQVQVTGNPVRASFATGSAAAGLYVHGQLSVRSDTPSASSSVSQGSPSPSRSRSSWSGFGESGQLSSRSGTRSRSRSS